MRKSFFAPIVALFFLLAAVPAVAQTASSIAVKDGAGASQTIGTGTANGKQFYGFYGIDANGLPVPLPSDARMKILTDTVSSNGTPAPTAQTVQATAWPLPVGAATLVAQTANTNAITATTAAAGTLATSSQTVTTVLPQLVPTAGLAISFGTTAATLFNANAARHFMTIQVQGAPDTTGTNGCYINGIAGATADANSLFLGRGGYFESATHVGTGVISIVCTGTMAVYSRQG